MYQPQSYLYTLFQNYLGMSPQQFLTTFRITKARELLESTNYPIESIALSCGYSDALVFTKAFHAMKGMSPSKYRKESHKEHKRTAPGGRGADRPAIETVKKKTLKMPIHLNMNGLFWCLGFIQEFYLFKLFSTYSRI